MAGNACPSPRPATSLRLRHGSVFIVAQNRFIRNGSHFLSGLKKRQQALLAKNFTILTGIFTLTKTRLSLVKGKSCHLSSPLSPPRKLRIPRQQARFAWPRKSPTECFLLRSCLLVPRRAAGAALYTPLHGCPAPQLPLAVPRCCMAPAPLFCPHAVCAFKARYRSKEMPPLHSRCKGPCPRSAGCLLPRRAAARYPDTSERSSAGTSAPCRLN